MSNIKIGGLKPAAESTASQEGTIQEALQAAAPAYKRPEGVYGVRLMQVARADGSIWKPNEEGQFVASTEEEKQLMFYYVSIGRMEVVK